MTLKQAFTQWAQAPRNTVLAANSNLALDAVIMKKYGDMPIESITRICKTITMDL